jgi:hypothetical protein
MEHILIIYQLKHEYWKDKEPSGFRIGYYTTIEEVEEVREHYITLPGFKDHPEGFQLSKHIVNSENCTSIWTADLMFEMDSDDYSMIDYVELGVFESKETAEKFVQFYKDFCGKEVNKGYFCVEQHKLGKSNWQDGFVTMYNE